MIGGWRETVLRPVALAQLERFVGDGRGQLGSLADNVHIRVIAGTLGMPWDDDAWIDRWVELTHANQLVKRYMSSPEVRLMWSKARSRLPQRCERSCSIGYGGTALVRATTSFR